MKEKNQTNLSRLLLTASGLICVLLLVAMQPVRPTKAAPPDATPTSTAYPWDNDLIPTFSMMQSDPDCVFPCWWGLKPGETTANEILDFLRPTGFERHWLGPLDLRDSIERAAGGVELYFREGIFHATLAVENNVLESTRLEFGNPDEWLPQDVDVSLPRVLAEIDATPEIFERSRSRRISRWVLLLLYREQGVLAEYTFNLRRDQVSERLDPFIMCLNLQRTTYIRFWLQSPHDEHPISDYLPGIESSIEIWSQNPNSERALTTPYYPFDQIYDVNADSFRQFFLDNPDNCLEALHR